MQFGFGAPVSGPLSTPDNLARIAAEGEAMGYDYATISDHVVIPRDIEAKYPYSDTGEFPGRSRGDRHEQLTAVAFVAGKTSRLRLVTSVTVVPHRPDRRRLVSDRHQSPTSARLDEALSIGCRAVAPPNSRGGSRPVQDGPCLPCHQLGQIFAGSRPRWRAAVVLRRNGRCHRRSEDVS